MQVTTTVPGQNGRLSFSSAADARIAVGISAGPLGTVAIVKPDGATHASGNIGAVAAFIDTTVLPVAGDYSLFADYLEANTGSVTLTLYAVPPDFTASTTATQAGSAVAVPTTVPGHNGIVTFPGTTDQRVSVKVSSFSPLGSVALRRPDGTTQASVASGIGAAFIDSEELETPGTYSLKVDPTNAATGTTTLTLYDVPPDTTGTVTIGGSAVAVSIGTPGQNGSLTFSGTQGQTVTVQMTNNTIGTSGIRGSTTVRLKKPDGTELTSTTSSALNFNLATQVLPVSGTYTIVIDPSGAHTGSINVAIANQ